MHQWPVSKMSQISSIQNEIRMAPWLVLLEWQVFEGNPGNQRADTAMFGSISVFFSRYMSDFYYQPEIVSGPVLRYWANSYMDTVIFKSTNYLALQETCFRIRDGEHDKNLVSKILGQTKNKTTPIWQNWVIGWRSQLQGSYYWKLSNWGLGI